MLRVTSLLPAALLLAGAALAQDRETLDIPMRDGKSLAADLYRSASDGPHPCILIQTPYDRKRFRRWMAPAAAQSRSLSSGPSVPLDREHYAYLVVDWRGRHGSKPAAAGRAAGKQLGRDGYDCVEWAAGQDWCDGKVGTWGGSALGKQQFQTAALKPPHLVCCVPTIASIGQKYASYYPGGVLREGHVQNLDLLGFGVGRLVRAFPYEGQLAWSIAERSSVRPQDFDVPMLLVTGWWDIEPQLVLDSFRRLVQEGGERTRAWSRMIVGPWDHMGVDHARQGDLRFEEAVGFSSREALAFFDYWLRGIGADAQKQKPRYQWFEVGPGDGGGGWRGGAQWPPVASAERSLWLGKAGTLARPAPGAETWRAITSDPHHPVPTLGGGNLRLLPSGPLDHRRLGKRKDVLVYSTGPLEEEWTLRGRPVFEVTCRADRVDFDVCARLCMTDAEERSLLLVDGIRRASFVEGSRGPRKIEPGTACRLRIELGPICVRLAKGRELRLYVSETNWRRFERNPHTGKPHWSSDEAVGCTIELLHGAARGSRLVLPVAR